MSQMPDALRLPAPREPVEAGGGAVPLPRGRHHALPRGATRGRDRRQVTLRDSAGAGPPGQGAAPGGRVMQAAVVKPPAPELDYHARVRTRDRGLAAEGYKKHCRT